MRYIKHDIWKAGMLKCSGGATTSGLQVHWSTLPSRLWTASHAPATLDELPLRHFVKYQLQWNLWIHFLGWSVKVFKLFEKVLQACTTIVASSNSANPKIAKEQQKARIRSNLRSSRIQGPRAKVTRFCNFLRKPFDFSLPPKETLWYWATNVCVCVSNSVPKSDQL